MILQTWWTDGVAMIFKEKEPWMEEDWDSPPIQVVEFSAYKEISDKYDALLSKTTDVRIISNELNMMKAQLALAHKRNEEAFEVMQIVKLKLMDQESDARGKPFMIPKKNVIDVIGHCIGLLYRYQSGQDWRAYREEIEDT